MVISISRRCDIPRFDFNWFWEKLEAGFVKVKNPFNPNQIRRVSLLPPAPERPAAESAELLAFWTRDPGFILKYTEELERRGYKFFVMCSLTSYPAILEPNAPSTEAVIETMKLLSEKTSLSRVIWRYDPLFFSNLTDFEFHRRNFANLAARLGGTVNRVILSVYDEYKKAEKRLKALEQSGCLKRPALCSTGLPDPAVRELLAELAQIARREGIEIQSCAEKDLSDCGIKPGACINGEYIFEHFGLTNDGRDRNQRPNCLYVKSVDIGSYGSCPAACVYCYAHSREP